MQFLIRAFEEKSERHILFETEAIIFMVAFDEKSGDQHSLGFILWGPWKTFLMD